MTRPPDAAPLAEVERLEADQKRAANWKRWGPYLSERQWGTVREDYSASGECWTYFSHDDARSRAYRWGEDGLLGICDRQGRLCFALGLWNGQDGLLKERLFGLTNPEGNHGEDVKEAYYYLDATPTYSYAKALYKYPQAAFPYQRLIDENRERGTSQPELELADCGVFDEGRYFDVLAEYAKASGDDLYIRLTVTNRGPDTAPLWLLPQLWLRNTWSWGRSGEGYSDKPSIEREGPSTLLARHDNLGESRLIFETQPGVEFLFTENETNTERLFKVPNASPYVKDAFHRYVIEGRQDLVNPHHVGTKACGVYALTLAPRSTQTVYLRLTNLRGATLDRSEAKAIFDRRILEADAFYASRIPPELSADERAVSRQAYAGLLWSKQFYYYVVEHWRDGDPSQPKPPDDRKKGRNRDWQHLYNRDVVSMPDKWEYPWYAAWDLAFHMVPFARIDPDFAKSQLLLFLREWYMHPNGQIPAYEFALGDVNPPVHAWAAWRVYKIAGKIQGRDVEWLKRVFQKLLLNFTWWVNRKDAEGNNLFSGGFLGLDNIGIFDRGQPLPTGGTLQQADGTAWMAFYASTMLAIALELASEDPSYEDMASKFFEHFVRIVDAMNTLGGNGLWDEEDGFYYDQMIGDGKVRPLKTRSIVGVIPLFAVQVLESEVIDKLPGFKRRLEWFLTNRQDLSRHISFVQGSDQKLGRHLLAVPSRERLTRVLKRVLDETEFLSSYGVRALSRFHERNPYVLRIGSQEWRVDYVAGESNSRAFGGNSNWRGPIWFPVNYLLIEALQRYHYFYGSTFQIECPAGSGKMLTLKEVAAELSARLSRIFLAEQGGRRAVHGDDSRYATDPAFKDLVLFYEYFNGDDGRGVGASHQTGWTSLVTRCLETVAEAREKK